MESIKELRRICQEPVIAGNTWYSRNFARRISIYLTKLLLLTSVSANQVTVTMIIMYVISGVLFAIDGYKTNVTAVLILQLAYILDHVDGEIARYRKQSSKKGKYLDLIANDFSHAFIFACISFGVYNHKGLSVLGLDLYHNQMVYLCGIGASIGLLLFNLSYFFTKEVNDGKEIHALNYGSNRKDLKYRIQTMFKVFVKYPGIMNILTLGAAMNLLHYILLGFGFLLPLVWLISAIVRGERLQ